MTTAEKLEILRKLAREDAALRKQLLEWEDDYYELFMAELEHMHQ